MSYVTNNFDDQVIELLKSGGVGFMPSDTIYGLSCRALDEDAVKRLHQIKQRDQKPFIVLFSNKDQLSLLGLNAEQLKPAFKYWPGKLTAVGHADDTPDYLQMGTNTLAVRLPDSPSLRQLIETVGPIISTSANLSGAPEVGSPAKAQAVFGEQLDFYVDSGEVSAQASTIVRIDGDKLEVIRQGEVIINDIG